MAEDGVWENGTSVTPTFNITSVDEYGINVNITEDMYDAVTGELTINLSVGAYIIGMLADDPSDENASEYLKFSSGLPTINVGLEEISEPFDIVFAPEYLVTGRVVMEDQQSPLENSTVWLRNEVGDDGHHYPECEKVIQEFWESSDKNHKKAEKIAQEFLSRRLGELKDGNRSPRTSQGP